MKKCTRCDAHKNKEGINCQEFFRGRQSILFFVGEMFGVQECKKGEPFVGQAGTVLTNLLSMIDLTKQDVSIDNACKCYIQGNKTPSKKILDACFVYLNRNLRSANPKLVIALGASAFYSLTGRKDFSFNVGRLIYSEKIKRKVYSIYHPAAGLHDPNKKDQIIEDFLKIPEMVDAEPFKRKDYPYILVNTDDHFDSMYEELVGHPLGLDLETSELDMYNKNSYIRTIQIGKKGRIFVIVPKIFNKYKDQLKNLLKNSQIIGQDFAFDAKWLAVKLDIHLKREWYFDVCLAEFILTGMKNNDLDYTTAKYNPDYYGYWEDVHKAGGAHLVQDKEKLYQYGANDIGTLFVIAKKQEKLLHRNNQHWLFKNITMPCNRILTEMSLRGIKLDINAVYDTDKKYKLKAEKALMRAKVLPGILECEYHFGKEFNPKSPDMIKWLLLDYYKLPVLKETKKGNPSVQHKEMKTYAEKHGNKYCQIMEHYRSIEAMRKNFLSGVVPKLVDGIAHTTYSLHATGSGRPNSKGINLLNIPREKHIKRCYVSRDGCSFVSGDEAQLEVRISAVVYNEPRLIEICNDFSKDIHSSITAKAFGKSYDEVYNGYRNHNVKMTELRVKGKGVQFGIIYQQQAEGLAYMLGITPKEAQQFINEYYENFPGLLKNIKSTKKKVIKDGYLYNYFRFKRSWRNHSEEDKGTQREAVNHPVQSLAWCLIQLAMIEIDKKLKEEELKGRLVLQVYDSIIVECPDEEVRKVAKVMKDVMENINQPYEDINRVKLKTDIEYGKNLADLEEIEL